MSCASPPPAPLASSLWPRVLSAGASGKTPVHLVGIQPYDGGAGPIGFNIEPAIMMALEQIEAANLLPNHTFVLHFYNSQCSKTAAIDELFAGHITLPRKFGVYGAACTGACKAAADVTRNFKTINMAQLCTGTDMSNENDYPEFARFAPDLGKNSQVALTLARHFGWERIAVVAEDIDLFSSMSLDLVSQVGGAADVRLISGAAINFVSDRGLCLSDDEYSAQYVEPLVEQLVAQDARVTVFIGYEKNLARFVCEASRRGLAGPKAVFIYATFWINADWATEFAPATRCSAAELSHAGESLIGIDRRRLADDDDGPHSGSGLLPSEFKAAYTARCSTAVNASNPGCSHMHAAYSYDAMWGWAFTLQRWLDAGNVVSSVDYVSDAARKSWFDLEVASQDFRGVTGRVRHYSNGDRDGRIQLFQIRDGAFLTIGDVVDQDQTLLWTAGVRLVWGGDEAYSVDPVDIAGGYVPSSYPTKCAQNEVLDYNESLVLLSERCVLCEAGKAAVNISNGETHCVECHAGFVARTAGSSCEACAAGTYVATTGQSACEQCPFGFQVDAGFTACRFNHQLVIVLIAICFVVALASGLLVCWLRRRNQRRIEKRAHQLRCVRTNEFVKMAPTKEVGFEYHIFLSHCWGGSGQANMRVIKDRLAVLLPSLVIFLDVDDLEKGGGAESVAVSHTVVCYLSEGYFSSPNCMREMAWAVYLRKPILLLIESPAAAGGVELNVARELLRVAYSRLANDWDGFKGMSTAPSCAEMESAVFGEGDATSWSSYPCNGRVFGWTNLRTLQDLMLRAIVDPLVRDMQLRGRKRRIRRPSSSPRDSVPSPRDFVPPRDSRVSRDSASEGSASAPLGVEPSESVGCEAKLLDDTGKPMFSTYAQADVERTRLTLYPPNGFHLHVCEANVGAHAMVKEIADASGLTISVNSQPAEMRRCERMLIYLNEDTWRYPAMAEEIKEAMKQRLPLLLVHEQPGLCQAANRACSFQQIIASTPRELLRAKIYHQIATPLSGGVYRVRSLLMLAKVLGKRPDKAPLISRELTSWLRPDKVVANVSAAGSAGAGLFRGLTRGLTEVITLPTKDPSQAVEPDAVAPELSSSPPTKDPSQAADLELASPSPTPPARAQYDTEAPPPAAAPPAAAPPAAAPPAALDELLLLVGDQPMAVAAAR